MELGECCWKSGKDGRGVTVGEINMRSLSTTRKTWKERMGPQDSGFDCIRLPVHVCLPNCNGSPLPTRVGFLDLVFLCVVSAEKPRKSVKSLFPSS